MANEVRTFTLNDDPGQVIEDLNAAFDGTTQTGLKAGDVKDSINGVALSEIFESDNKTVKKATNATLAEAAKGDTRFQVSGHYVLSSPLTLCGTGYYLGSVFRLLPAHKSIKIVRAAFSFPGFSVGHVRLVVFPAIGSTWSSSTTSQGDETPNFVMQTNPTDSPVDCYLRIRVFSPGPNPNTADSGSIFSWWLDLAIEDI